MKRRDFVPNDFRFQLSLRAVLIVLVLGVALSPVHAQEIRMKTARFDPLAAPPALQGLPSEKISRAKPAPAVAAPGELRVALIQWAGGLSNEKLAAFQAAGGRPIGPVPTDAYLAMVPAWMDLKNLGLQKTLAGKNAPRWAGELAPEWKLDPHVAQTLPGLLKADAKATTPSRYLVQFALTGGEKTLRGALRSLGRAQLYTAAGNTESWAVETWPAAVETLAKMNAVFWIAPFPQNKLLAERAGLSIANEVNSNGSDVKAPGTYAAWLKKVGLSGQGITVQVMDDGLGQGIASNMPGTAHLDLLGRIAGIDNPTNDPLGNSTGGHGHLNASIIMGQPVTGGGMKDPGGFLLGQGVAPNARVWATKIFSNNFGFYDPFPFAVSQYRTMDSLVQVAYTGGAIISSNSWGANVFGMYDQSAQLFDRLTRDASMSSGYQPMTFIFSAGNAGTAGSSSLGSPGTAKNVITVGAGENSDKGELDGSMNGPDESSDIRDIADFSSRGPASDGRLLPTLFAPGTHVAGAASEDLKFSGSGVSGRLKVATNENISNKKYYPAHQNAYTWSSGTSHACPTVAGAVALLFEFCKKAFGAYPSPAMTKAMLVAGCVDTAGGNRNFLATNNFEKLMPIPNNDAGWGRCSLAGLVDGTRHFFRVDQTALLTFNTQTFTYRVPVADPAAPLRIVLAWTDPPANMISLTALVNDLDLTVSNGVETWRGNVFANGHSVTGGSADHLNNLECVFIPKPLPAVYTITISAYNLLGDALPSTGDSLEQDFALFVSNGDPMDSTGRIALDQAVYRVGEVAIVTLNDADLKGRGTAQVSVSSLNVGDVENVTLAETPAASGFFRGQLAFVATGTATPNNGVLTVTHRETIMAAYVDGGGVKQAAWAGFDKNGPVMLGHDWPAIMDTVARCHILTDEPTSVTITYGEFPTRLRLTQSSTNLATEHELLLSPLLSNSSYFYQIALSDAAGNRVVYDNGGLLYTFFTKANQLDYFNDFSADTTGWTHSAGSGIDDWLIANPYPDDPANRAWMTHDNALVKDLSLVSPAIKLNPNARMRFFHWYKFQPYARTYGFDGGVLEMSTDNGISWKDMNDYIQKPMPGSGWAGTYDAILATGSGNALGGRMAWCGRSWDKLFGGPYRGSHQYDYDTSASTSNYRYTISTDVDLAAFANQTVKFRFRIGTNNNTAGDRWIIDDFAVFSPLEGVTSLARLKFDSPMFNGGMSRIRFTLRDSGLSSATGAFPTGFRLATQAFPDGIPFQPIDLKRIDPAGIWEGYIPISPDDPLAKTVVVAFLYLLGEGQQVKLLYEDTDVGDGSLYTVSDTTALDWTPPDLLTHNVSLVRNHDFKIELESNEPVTVEIRLGPSLSQLNRLYTYNDFATARELMTSPLIADTPYYYTITLRDIAGNSALFDNGGYGFGVRTKSYVRIRDDLEPGPSFSYSQQTDWGINAWRLVENLLNSSPTHSWFGTSTPTRNDSSLILRNVEIKDGYGLRFMHAYQLDPGLDGGVIEISTDQGHTWLDLAPQIVAGVGYNYVIAWEYGSPIAGQPAWSGTDGMREVNIDLSPYVGTGRMIRWRLVCDDNKQMRTGWFIDDITLDTYGPSTLDFPSKPILSSPVNGKTGVPFNTDLSLSWAPSSIANKYRIYVGEDPEHMFLQTETVSTRFPISEPSLKPGRWYYWRVVAVNNTGVVPSDLRTFKTQIIDVPRFANYLVGISPGLTVLEKGKADYNGSGIIDVSDLIDNIRRR